MNFLSLFSGIGGFDLGAQWAGLKFDKHYYSDIDDYANKVFQLRFPEAIPLGDICSIKGKDLPHGEWIIAGGFPCQDISVAGKGAGLAGARSGLWYEYARLIGELRPRFAIMENVGALTHRGLDAVLGSLAEIGYDAEWQDIRASDVGAPHRRERIWIVAYPDSEHGDRGAEPQQPASAGGKPRDQPLWGGVAGDVADTDEILRDGGGGTRDGRPEPSNGSQGVANADKARSQGQCQPCGTGKTQSRARRDYECTGQNWAAEPDVGRVAHGVPARVDRLKCLGNSIVPQIAELIFRETANYL
jgi:DNA (cytosine-5)-methyltransferase 1